MLVSGVELGVGDTNDDTPVVVTETRAKDNEKEGVVIKSGVPVPDEVIFGAAEDAVASNTLGLVAIILDNCDTEVVTAEVRTSEAMVVTDADRVVARDIDDDGAIVCALLIPTVGTNVGEGI